MTLCVRLELGVPLRGRLAPPPPWLRLRGAVREHGSSIHRIAKTSIVSHGPGAIPRPAFSSAREAISYWRGRQAAAERNAARGVSWSYDRGGRLHGRWMWRRGGGPWVVV